jgi:hypothetical protein
MVQVNISEDCGNSPKNTLLQNMAIAFARGDVDFILSVVTDDIRWDIVGDRVIQGKGDLDEALRRAPGGEAAELTVLHVATHGKAGAVNGTLKTVNGTTIAFCDVVEFGNAKGTNLKEITSYRIILTAGA